MNPRPLFLILALGAAGCSTMNESLQLGGSIGAATGATTMLTAYGVAGKSPSLGAVALGTGIGSAVGLLSAYLIHNQVATERSAAQADQTEMHFGDLPPSPFIVPRMPNKGASHE